MRIFFPSLSLPFPFRKHWTAFGLFVVLSLFALPLPVPGLAIPRAHAEATPAYSAAVVGASFEKLTIRTGQSITFWVDIRNTGTATWTNRGNHFIALNVTAPSGRKSAFKHRTWRAGYRPARLTTESVRPGDIGRVRFALQAPQEAGEYSESFQLVAEYLTWIPGSAFTIPIRVIPPPPAYRAEIVAKSAEQVSVEPSGAITYWVDVRNTGTATWTNRGNHFIALNVTAPTGRASLFQHRTWREFSYRPARLTTESVRPGDIGRVRFALQAPQEAGEYSESFQLVAEYLTWIPGSAFTIPIRVAPIPTTTTDGEPEIAVGLRALTEPLQIRANGPATITTSDKSVVASLSAQTIVTLSYADGIYTATLPDRTLSGALPYRVTPDSPDVVVEAVNFENRPAWNLDLNDNVFRGSLRIEHAATSGATWLINSLPLESYLRGIAETSNASHAEFQKALIVAARTYARYHLLSNTKHAAEHFTVDASYDQVYRGYNFELRSPNVVQAVIDTQGLVVTHNGTVAITPYFSQSDGRTRSWEEVWSGGPYAWLVTKPVVEDSGRPLLGHGVGMSAHGALLMAENGKTYQEILAYFYTNTALQKQY